MTDAGISGDEWTRRFADALGVPPPSEEEREALLGLAGIAAHASERTAAPLSTWLAGRSALAPDDAREAAQRLSAAIAPPPQ